MSLPMEDAAIGTVLHVFAQMFGCSLLVSVAWNVLATRVLKLFATIDGQTLGMSTFLMLGPARRVASLETAVYYRLRSS